MGALLFKTYGFNKNIMLNVLKKKNARKSNGKWDILRNIKSYNGMLVLMLREAGTLQRPFVLRLQEP